jgi:ABC-type dipeptide/oligopeptide/nickel transport system permease component
VFYAVLFVAMQLVLDIVYTLIDPRIRVGGKK